MRILTLKMAAVKKKKTRRRSEECCFLHGTRLFLRYDNALLLEIIVNQIWWWIVIAKARRHYNETKGWMVLEFFKSLLGDNTQKLGIWIHEGGGCQVAKERKDRMGLWLRLFKKISAHWMVEYPPPPGATVLSNAYLLDSNLSLTAVDSAIHLLNKLGLEL